MEWTWWRVVSTTACIYLVVSSDSQLSSPTPHRTYGESYLPQHAFISWFLRTASCQVQRLTELYGESYLPQYAFISWFLRRASCQVQRLTELDDQSHLPQHAFISWVHRRVSCTAPRVTKLFHVRERLNHAIPGWTVTIGREIFASMAPQLQTEHTVIP